MLSILLAATWIMHSSGQNKSIPDYSGAFPLVEVWLEAEKDYNDLPGITASIIYDQEMLWSAGFGLANRESAEKARPSTLFSICSISKLFTSVAIMKLYDEGKLRLDDQIDELLPWYNLKQAFPGSGPITIRSLMTHSSGLPRESDHPYWTGPDFPFPTQAEIRDGLRNQETLYPSSTYLQYSNLAMTLLGEIVEEVSGLPYHEFIQKNILEPLKLNDTRTELPEALYGTELAIGYSAHNRARKRAKVDIFQANGITPAAGFSSNVEDLGTFASWQFRLLDSDEAEILKPSTLDYMHRVHWTDPDWETTWGLGFSVYRSDGQTLVGHGGSCPGYRSSLVINPDKKMAYSVMINASGTNPGGYISGIRGILSKYKELEDIDSLKPGQSKTDFTPYEGYYTQQPWWSELYVTSWKGKLLLLDLPTDDPAKSITFFRHIEDDTFRRIRDDKELGETLVFERDEQGKVTRMKRHGNYSERIK